MESDSKPMNTKELSQAVAMLLEREKHRGDEERRRNRKRKRDERLGREAMVTQVMRSIEVIKWCILGITTVMVVALVVLIMVVMEVQQEAERIKAEVVHIQREAEMIREKIRHPLESMGGLLGRQFDKTIAEQLGFGGGAKEEPKE